MRHALDIQRARLLISVDAGGIQRGDAPGVAEEENDILGVLLREQRNAEEEEKRGSGKHHSIVTGSGSEMERGTGVEPV